LFFMVTRRFRSVYFGVLNKAPNRGESDASNPDPSTSFNEAHRAPGYAYASRPIPAVLKVRIRVLRRRNNAFTFARQCFNLFPDELFADLFTDVGRRSVPPMIVAVVMVLQRFEGCSDREAVERFAFDARWKYAAGGLDFDYPGFVHTVLVDMRARLAGSERPNRIFEVTLEAARRAGLVGRRRVLDSTPLYDAVATMDTVTLVRSAIRGLLRAADPELEEELRGCCAATTTMRVPGSRSATGTTRRPGRRWWTRWPAMRWRCWAPSMGRSWARSCRRRRRCWPPWWVRTWTPTPTGCSGSPGRWPRTG
jgi:hypothetical protein